MINDLPLSHSDADLIKMELAIYHATKEYKLADLGLPALQVIAERLQLELLLEVFLRDNKTKAEYHNNYHSICVALNCYEGAVHEQLSESTMRYLVAAALFHDFNHSGGIFQDEQNIDIAIFGLVKACRQQNIMSDSDLEQAIFTLRVTKYPYDRVPVTMSEMIIRDADLMQAYDSNLVKLKEQYVGLKTEIERMQGITFTNEEFAAGQQAWFRENVKWQTTWAANKASIRDWERTKQQLVETMSMP